MQILRLLTLFAVATAGLPANAQQAVIEEVVVTAQKRAESSQDVPISVSALGGDFVRDAGITNVAEVVALVPGVSSTVDGPTQSVLAIRGIGTSAFSASSDASVGVFVDDVYAGHPLIAAQSFFDVERIEVVKGPQGTLFGRNTSAGAISIISKKADRDEFYGDLRASVGSKGQRTIEGIGNFSSSENWGIRVGAQYEERDGTFKNSTDGTELNNIDDLLLRFAWQADLNDRWRSDLSVQYTSSDAYFGRIGVDVNNRDASAEIETVTQNSRENQDIATVRTALRLEYDINDELALTSITSYLDADIKTIPFDADLFPVRILEFREPNTFKYLSQEFRINGGGDNVDWFVGVSFRDEEVTSNTELSYSDFDIIDALIGDPCTDFEAMVGVTCNPNVVEPSLAVANNSSWGIYGDVSWQATDRLNFTIGGRFSSDDKDLDQNTPFAGSIAVAPNLLGDNVLELATLGTLRTGRSWDNFSPRIALKYDLTDESMLYGNVSAGYKAGGFNSGPDRPFGGLGPGEVQDILGFEPEESVAYEVGIKSMLADGRLRLNVAGYFIDYSDFQIETFSGLAFNIQNVADAENVGVDIEAQWLATDNFEVNFGYAYLDSEIDKGIILDPDTGAPINISGNRMPFAPESSVFLTGEYSLATDLGDWSFRVAYSHTDDIFLSPFQDSVVDTTRSYGKLDIQVGLEGSDGRWSVALVGENVTDERWFTSMSDVLEPQGVPNIGDLWRLEFFYRVE